MDGVYRSAEERLNWLQYAPIERLRFTLLELQHAGEVELDRLSATTIDQMEASADRAEMAPHPLPGSARRQVWRKHVTTAAPHSNAFAFVHCVRAPKRLFPECICCPTVGLEGAST